MVRVKNTTSFVGLHVSGNKARTLKTCLHCFWVFSTSRYITIAKQIDVGEEIELHKFILVLQSTIALVIASLKNLTHIHFGKLVDEPKLM